MKGWKLAGCALLLALAATAARAEKQAPADDDCYSRAEDGTCIDAPVVPRTGQFQGFDSEDDGKRPANLRDTQHHANVILTEDTFVYAHNICRWVGNATTNGVSFFIGLETKAEWKSFLDHPPVGAQIEKCCKPIKIERCGRQISVGFGKSGQTFGPFTAGYDFRSTYRCVTGVDGEGATEDTSWLEGSTGSCEPDEPTDNGGGGNDNQGNGSDNGGGGESRDGNGDGTGDGASDGPPAKGNDGQCGGGKC